MEEAKEMILQGRLITKRTGVETMSKFQLFGREQITNPKHVEYCMNRALTLKDAKILFEYGVEIGQTVFFTCMAPKFVDWCETIGIKYYKIRYYDRYNMKLVDKIKKTNKTTFISLDNEQDIFEYHRDYGFKPLLCNPKYPSNLKHYLQHYWLFSRCLGFSDHIKNLTLFQIGRDLGMKYHERHVCLNGQKQECIEKEWVSEFQDIRNVLNHK